MNGRRRLRVVHVFKDVFPPTFGGVEQHVWDVTRSLARDFECVVLTSSRTLRRVTEELDGVTIVRAPELGRVVSTPITPTWWTELRRARADVVHVHLPNPLAELACLTYRPGPPVVATLHADVTRSPRLARWYRPVQRRFLSGSNPIVVGSPVLAGAPLLTAHRDRVVVIPYGVDPDEWPANPSAVADIRRAHGEPIVLFLGRLVSYKGVDVLMEAMRSVDASLVVVGDGPARGELEARARRAVLGDKVRFVGNVSNELRSAYYRAADVFVAPAVSSAETFGIAMLEAMAQGTPAISTEVGTATTWVNRPGETGTAVPPRDPAALAAALTDLLADDARRKELGEAAAHRARAQFSKQAMLDRLVEVYESAARSVSWPRD